MKMIYNGTPVKSLKVKHYEISTNDCDMIASDLQSGKTAVARGKKITGTGKSFEFAQYGRIRTNSPIYVPNNVNVIEVGSSEYPVKLAIPLSEIRDVDFSVVQVVAYVNIDNSEAEITAQVKNNILTFACSETIHLEAFFAKDNY